MDAYKTVTVKVKVGLFSVRLQEDKADAVLNQMARDGWTLVAAYPIQDHFGFTRQVAYTFRRSMDQSS